MIPVPPTATKASGIDWYSFLARPRLPSPAEESLEQLRDASVLVTGAGGSIGSALSLRLAKLHLRQLVLLDASEQALYRLQSALADTALPARPRFVLANITDPVHLDEIFETDRPNLVFHAAAYKHVSLLEEHPLEAIANNALGTFTLSKCAKDSGTARIVLLSTDKAVAPISILGATKCIAEQITLVNDGVVLRLGNVLQTEGSVSETFLCQIAVGDLITITDPNAERYFLTQEEAVDLLLAAAVGAPSGSLLAPSLDRQYSISSLANFLFSACSLANKPPIILTRLRAGEKISESLWSSDEEPLLRGISGYVELQQQVVDPSALRCDLMRLKDATRDRDLVRAMELVRVLVPNYKPSATIMAVTHQSKPGARPGALRR